MKLYRSSEPKPHSQKQIVCNLNRTARVKTSHSNSVVESGLRPTGDHVITLRHQTHCFRNNLLVKEGRTPDTR